MHDIKVLLNDVLVAFLHAIRSNYLKLQQFTIDTLCRHDVLSQHICELWLAIHV